MDAADRDEPTVRAASGKGTRCIMRRTNTKRPVFVELQNAKIGFADASGVLEDPIENRLQVPRRRADDLENLGGGGKLLQCLVTLAGELCRLRFLDGTRRTATAHNLPHVAALQRHRLATPRFNWVAPPALERRVIASP